MKVENDAVKKKVKCIINVVVERIKRMGAPGIRNTCIKNVITTNATLEISVIRSIFEN
jgi:hypothetical protein